MKHILLGVLSSLTILFCVFMGGNNIFDRGPGMGIVWFISIYIGSTVGFLSSLDDRDNK